MNARHRRLFDLIESIVPQPVQLKTVPEHVGLGLLGFDSMTMISLFAELEDKLGLPVDALQLCLNKACTLGSLLELCGRFA